MDDGRDGGGGGGGGRSRGGGSYEYSRIARKSHVGREGKGEGVSALRVHALAHAMKAWREWNQVSMDKTTNIHSALKKMVHRGMWTAFEGWREEALSGKESEETRLVAAVTGMAAAAMQPTARGCERMPASRSQPQRKTVM